MAVSAPILEHVDSGDVLDIGLAGGPLHTAGNADSSWIVQIGQVAEDVQVINFAGMHGVFTEVHGTGGRPIIWFGVLRVTEAALLAIYTARDAWRLKVGRMKFTCDLGVEYDDCRILSFEILEKRKLLDRPPLEWYVPYRIVLQQMVV